MKSKGVCLHCGTRSKALFPSLRRDCSKRYSMGTGDAIYLQHQRPWNRSRTEQNST